MWPFLASANSVSASSTDLATSATRWSSVAAVAGAMASAARSAATAAMRGMVPSLCWLAAALTPPLGSGQAAADPLDLRPTDLTIAEFAQLGPAEQQRFRAGFALAVGDAEIAGGGQRVAAVLAQHPPPRPGPITGADWVALPPRERLALLAGYNAGAWAVALTATAGRSDDAALAQARRLVRPAPVPAPSLLAARLADWLFYTDRRAAPLTESIATIMGQIAQGAP